MKKTIDTSKLSESQIRAMVRHGIIDKSELIAETLDATTMEAMNFCHRHFKNDDLASMAGVKTATWVWNMSAGNMTKMYSLIIERMQITQSELLIIQSAARVMNRIWLKDQSSR